jgi:hypothetical protein
VPPDGKRPCRGLRGGTIRTAQSVDRGIQIVFPLTLARCGSSSPTPEFTAPADEPDVRPNTVNFARVSWLTDLSPRRGICSYIEL